MEKIIKKNQIIIGALIGALYTINMAIYDSFIPIIIMIIFSFLLQIAINNLEVQDAE